MLLARRVTFNSQKFYPSWQSRLLIRATGDPAAKLTWLLLEAVAKVVSNSAEILSIIPTCLVNLLWPARANSEHPTKLSIQGIQLNHFGLREDLHQPGCPTSISC